jgi:predicted transcriptional regulator
MHRDDRVRDSFTLSKRLSARVQRLARRARRSRSSIYRAAVEDYLDRHEQAAVTAAINAALGNDAQDLDFVEAAGRAIVDAGLVDEWSE